MAVREHRCINVKAQENMNFQKKGAREARAGVIILYIPQILQHYVAENLWIL
jgi:hypothetical protein